MATKLAATKVASNAYGAPYAKNAHFRSGGSVRFLLVGKSPKPLFFPVFSGIEEMGEYGNNFSKVEKHFLEAMIYAKNNENDLSGIVVNAFTEPFVLDKELWEAVEKLDSRLSK